MATNEQLNGIANQHKQIWERLFSLLKGHKAGSPNSCHILAQTPAEERRAFIDQTWGRAALQKVEPILAQIESLEQQAGRVEQKLAEQPATGLRPQA